MTPEQLAIAETAAAAGLSSPHPSLDAIRAALATVPDPEVPVLSVVDLGIVRAIEWDAADPALLVVRVTPTYSGCPATDVIVAAIGEALAAVGVPRVRIEMQLSPPWTTDWLSPEARERLRAYGIAPPATAKVNVAGISPLRRHDVPPRASYRAALPEGAQRLGAARRRSVVVPCPRCGSERTRLLAQFGSTACKAQYRCDDCLEPFEYFKPH